MNTDFTNIVPSRDLNLDYIILDSLFLVLLLVLLIIKKRYLTVLYALFGGILYFIVDWGIFYKWLGARNVTGANTALFLFWLSMSYGITNFAFIWLAIKKDKHLIEFSLMIFIWWIVCPLIALPGGAERTISIYRTTGSYHAWMAIFLVVGYFIVVMYNLKVSDKKKKLPIIRMFIIGVVVQFGWEFALLVTGIRKPGIGPLIINSLLETNMGIPYMYFIYKGITSKVNEDLTLVKKKEEIKV